jgi:hypothetical protein
VLPALLVLWVRAAVHEPESWRQARAAAAKGEGRALGSFRDLLLNPRWAGRAFLGMLLAAVGLGTFWGVAVAGQDLAREMLLREGASPAVAAEKAKFAYGILQTAGAGLGMLSFGPLCLRLGRRRAFILFHLAAFLLVPIVCFVPRDYPTLLALLPLMGFFVVGLHAGYAVYFPELFPHHLRSSGTGFCFNARRGGPALLRLAQVTARDGFAPRRLPPRHAVPRRDCGGLVPAGNARPTAPGSLILRLARARGKSTVRRSTRGVRLSPAPVRRSADRAAGGCGRKSSGPP